MIKVEGYRAFHGVIKIIPVNREPFYVESDWLFKPDTQCWYGKGSSYPEQICEIVRDDNVL